jgi:hypothetical protein
VRKGGRSGGALDGFSRWNRGEKGKVGAGLALRSTTRREEEVASSAAHARARGGDWRRQRPVPTEAGGN